MLKEIDLLSQWFKESQRPLFFTGAGISTESGIPDFRGPNGFWTKYQPIQYADFINSAAVRLTSWERHFQVREKMLAAEPNVGHKVITSLMRAWPDSALITQNVDDLHQNAGVDPTRIIELHGNATYAQCLSCHKRYATAEIQKRIEKEHAAPHCTVCHGIIKTATISFGQPMPEQAVQKSIVLAANCDLFLCLGSSLAVYPAASIPAQAQENGAKLVIINNEATPYDSVADLVIQESLGATLSALAEKLQLAAVA